MKRLLFCLTIIFFCTSCVLNRIEPVCSSNEQLATQVSPTLPQPLIKIITIIDATSSEDVSNVSLSNFKLDGESINPKEAFSFDNLLQEHQKPVPNSTIIEDGIIRCTVSCDFGFSAEEGTYSFDVSAEGYITKSIEVSATYLKSETGFCGHVYRDNNVKLDLILESVQ